MDATVNPPTYIFIGMMNVAEADRNLIHDLDQLKSDYNVKLVICSDRTRDEVERFLQKSGETDKVDYIYSAGQDPDNKAFLNGQGSSAYSKIQTEFWQNIHLTETETADPHNIILVDTNWRAYKALAIAQDNPWPDHEFKYPNTAANVASGIAKRLDALRT